MNSSIRVVLVNPPSNCVNDDRVEPPLGLLYIAANLREKDYRDVSICDISGARSELEIKERMGNVPSADVYGVSCFCTNYQYAKELIKHIKSVNRASYVVIGGPNPSGTPKFTLANSGADTVVVGEGEDIFKDCIDSFVNGSGLVGIQHGVGRTDIDSYAFPARDLVDLTTYSRELMGNQVISLLSSRGCKHHCVHCNSVVMGGGNKTVRYRSPDNVIDEIKTMRDSFAYYRFNDDHFTGSPNLEDLLTRMKDLDITFRIFARIEDLNEKNSRLLKEAGCVHVSVGLESLYPANLKIISKKSQVGHEDNVRIARSNGLVVRSSFMVGLPFDTDETVEQSFTRAAQLGVDEFAVYPLIPYPGTSIAKFPERFGYTIVQEDFTDYVQIGKDGRTSFALRHKNFSPEDVKRWLILATEILKSGGAKHMSESKVAR
ncbi:MAG: cobalamin-dependent protein [Nanoarchaeota archaeon]|nr:cobalamin-dependent protein [Nanoarchaeota archaeon]MBU1270454.1 cobalamin-dependent protein [Nanoarchaeota archaeon]MBU1605186.1 cobalamin-dependent protein [Nanoarchaeota archaeon]MBU2443704.1 cobalamin-dependent protein [Nanoarchaeota archaeon]